MYKIGDTVIYGSSGVVVVEDIREENFAGEKRMYYVLRSPSATSQSLTFVPLDNEKLTSLMRPLISKKDIYEILSAVDKNAEEEWISDNRARSERFKKVIENGDARGMISMIRSIYQNGKERQKNGKKNYLSDENAMKKAERLLYSEFSAVLGIPEDDVPSFIEKEIEKA